MFDLIQNVGAWVAAPIAAVFLLGVLWRRTTAAAATFVLLFAFPYTALVEYVLFKHVPWLMPFDNWLNRTFVVWATSMVLLVVVSLVHAAPAAGEDQGHHLVLAEWPHCPRASAQRNRGLAQPVSLVVPFSSCLMAALYAYMIWFQFWGPGSRQTP